MSKPTKKDLDLHLKDLVNWERFALHLPGVSPTEIDIIKKNKRDDVVDQRLELYETWLRIYPNASWGDVILALEKVQENTIASTVRSLVFHTIAAISPKKTLTDEVQVSKDVVQKLEKLHTDFALLTTEVKSTFSREVRKDQSSLKKFKDYIEEQKAFEVKLELVKTADQFLNAITPHYNFLDCYLLIRIAILLSGSVARKAKKYERKAENFMKETKVRDLSNTLNPYFQNFRWDKSTRVSVRMESSWGKQNLWLVNQLVQQLFSLQHADQCQWFEVVPGSLIVVFSAIKSLTKSLIENIKKKLQFMKLIGVIGLQIGDEF